MKTNFKAIVVTMFIGMTISQLRGQGFINLNFENPILPLIPDGGFVQTANAIPGWNAYLSLSGDPLNQMGYNFVSIGGSIVTLNDTNASGSATALRPIQGKYSIVLYASQYGPYAPAGIGQTGQIPNTANSLSFIGVIGGTFQITFNGHPVYFFLTGSTADYNLYAADISAYSGQTGELRFTSISPGAALLDNFQFSSTAVPEPCASTLIALGGLLLARRRWRKGGGLI